ncbi:putative serine/threonine protein kinase [Powai lake megavirus]|uniref:Putative serine/threonine protein kinase n=1 Tax=Powai lake megavirus TaxID=1842663 RepID=A0A167RIZ6_9VIRU|nr:putative serine/threonine protein kinase [Powai lake megavirus]ANB50738.1 putative serine/threonine protein kinase [Powai lake megavirus]
MQLINNRYEIKNIELGSGGFSKVYLGIDIDTGENVAIKKIPLKQDKISSQELMNKLSIEIEIMQKLDHPNIVKYYDVYKNNKYWFIIMEYCNAGTLGKVIEYNEMSSKNDIHFDREENSHYYLHQLVNALEYIINLGYIHRDIKPLNVLLSSENNDWDGKNYGVNEKLIVKLADFGLAKEFTKCENELMKSLCGSPAYMAPEILLNPNAAYDSKIDIWSFGVIMYQLLFGKHPNRAQNINHLKELLENKRIEFNYNKNFSKQCYNLLKSVLTKDQKNRIEWYDLFNHEWFYYWKNIDKDSNILIHNNIIDTQNEQGLFQNISDVIGSSNLTKIKNYTKTEAIIIPQSRNNRSCSEYHDEFDTKYYIGKNSIERPNKYIFISPDNIFPLNLSKFIKDDYTGK